MQTPIKQILADSKESDKLPDAGRAVQAAIRETLSRVNKRGEIDTAIDADLVRLSAAAAERDERKIDSILAAIATKRATRAQLTEQIAAATEDSGALLAPLVPAINAAIAIGPAIAVLAECWHDLDPEIQSRIIKKTDRRIAW